MPLYKYKCNACGSEKQRVREVPEGNLPFGCDQDGCGGNYIRNVSPPGVNKVERLDNGIMVKAVERPADVERMMQERKGLDDRLRRGE